MVSLVGIIGHGYVGKGMQQVFPDAAIYDIGTQPDNTALYGASLILICVPTPMADDGSCDTSAVEDAIYTARHVAPDALICIKSAVPIGFTDKHQCGKLHVSPEYMGEGRNFVPPWHYPDPVNALSHDFVIVGGPRAVEVLEYFQGRMATTAHYHACAAKEAEAVKRFENAFFATKVTLVNEFYDICQANGLDWIRVRELWLADSRIGRSHTAVFPSSRGFGGKCLPKDLSALINEANGADVSLLEAVMERNEKWR